MAPKRRFSILQIQSELTEFRLTEVRSFIEHSRSGMSAIWNKFSRDFDATTAGWPKDQVDEYVNHIYDDLASVRDQSPQLLRHAQCMIVYGTFENAIVGLCRTAHRDGKIANTPPTKMYMDDVKGYLLPHVRQRPQPFAQEWQWLHEFRIIRNWMAHNGGRADMSGGNWTRARTFARRNTGLIKFGQFGDISVEDPLVDRACDKTIRAVSRLEKAVRALP